MRSKLIINPSAGHKGGLPTNRAGLDDVREALAAHGIAPDVDETARPGHATELARAAVAAGYDLVIAAGGDGTVREAAIGLLGSQLPLGIMPLGSVMNVARMLGIPRDLEGAAEVIARRDCAHIDVGRAAGAYFLEMAGVGIDAALFRYGNELDRGHWQALGLAARAAVGFRPQPVRLEIDGWTVEMEALMVTVANGPYCGAAFLIAPDARLDDHRLDVRVFGPMPKLDLLRLVLRPTHEASHAHVHSFKAREMRITSLRPLPAHADSWPIGVTPLRFSLLPSALAVLVGPEVRAACQPLSQPPERLAVM